MEPSGEAWEERKRQRLHPHGEAATRTESKARMPRHDSRPSSGRHDLCLDGLTERQMLARAMEESRKTAPPPPIRMSGGSESDSEDEKTPPRRRKSDAGSPRSPLGVSTSTPATTPRGKKRTRVDLGSGATTMRTPKKLRRVGADGTQTPHARRRGEREAGAKHRRQINSECWQGSNAPSEGPGRSVTVTAEPPISAAGEAKEVPSPENSGASHRSTSSTLLGEGVLGNGGEGQGSRSAAAPPRQVASDDDESMDSNAQGTQPGEKLGQERGVTPDGAHDGTSQPSSHDTTFRRDSPASDVEDETCGKGVPPGSYGARPLGAQPLRSAKSGTSPVKPAAPPGGQHAHGLDAETVAERARNRKLKYGVGNVAPSGAAARLDKPRRAGAVDPPVAGGDEGPPLRASKQVPVVKVELVEQELFPSRLKEKPSAKAKVVVSDSNLSTPVDTTLLRTPTAVENPRVDHTPPTPVPLGIASLPATPAPPLSPSLKVHLTFTPGGRGRLKDRARGAVKPPPRRSGRVAALEAEKPPPSMAELSPVKDEPPSPRFAIPLSPLEDPPTPVLVCPIGSSRAPRSKAPAARRGAWGPKASPQTPARPLLPSPAGPPCARVGGGVSRRPRFSALLAACARMAVADAAEGGPAPAPTLRDALSAPGVLAAALGAPGVLASASSAPGALAAASSIEVDVEAPPLPVLPRKLLGRPGLSAFTPVPPRDAAPDGRAVHAGLLLRIAQHMAAVQRQQDVQAARLSAHSQAAEATEDEDGTPEPEPKPEPAAPPCERFRASSGADLSGSKLGKIRFVADDESPPDASFGNACEALQKASANFPPADDFDGGNVSGAPAGSPRGRTTRSAPIAMFIPARHTFQPPDYQEEFQKLVMWHACELSGLEALSSCSWLTSAGSEPAPLPIAASLLATDADPPPATV